MERRIKYVKLGEISCKRQRDQLISISVFLNIARSPQKFLESVRSLVKSDWDCHDIVLVDNGSSDRTYEILLDFSSKIISNGTGKRVHVLRLPYNMGFAKANNIAYYSIAEKYGPYKYVALVNNDAKVYPKAFRILTKVLELSDSIAGVQGILINKKSGIDSASLYWTAGFFLNSGPIILPRYSPESLLYPQIVSYLDGAFSIYKAEAIESVGFFDVDSFMYGDDYVLGAKLWEKGYLTVYVPVIVGEHERGLTRSLAKKTFIVWAKMNEERFTKKLPKGFKLIRYGTVPFSLFDLALRIVLLRVLSKLSHIFIVDSSKRKKLEEFRIEYEGRLQGIINAILWEPSSSFKEYKGPLLVNTYPFTIPLESDLSIAVSRRGISEAVEYYTNNYILKFFKAFFNK